MFVCLFDTESDIVGLFSLKLMMFDCFTQTWTLFYFLKLTLTLTLTLFVFFENNIENVCLFNTDNDTDIFCLFDTDSDIYTDIVCFFDTDIYNVCGKTFFYYYSIIL